MMKKPDITASTINKIVYSLSLIITFQLLNVTKLNAQTIYPPNHSFEDDTNQIDISPWKINQKYFLPHSINMNLPTDGDVFIMFESYKENGIYHNCTLSNQFALNSKIKVLKFDAMFGDASSEDQYRVQLDLFQYDTFHKKRIFICHLDTMMDTINNYRTDYRDRWVSQAIDLRKFYINEKTPDSCIITFSCDIVNAPSYDVGQILFLDNIRFELHSSEVQELTKIKHPPIKIYPNPTVHSFTIEHDEPDPLSVLEIYDSQGVCVASYHQIPNVFQIDVSQFSAQTLFIHAMDALGNSSTYKLVIQ
jgi:hypothetical protein